ncbi:hypothetical protein LTR17_022472 [Elasticomyces elasticus]|nr:hypothetical protein LTR17_022472 [Elasticomyces elasticus]
MQRRSIQSGQFYAAFYRWATLTTPRRCPHVARRTLSATSYQREFELGRVPPSRFTIRKHSASDRNAVRNQDTGKSWQTQPVQNAAERPFSGLRAWELAVRYKSDNGVMLEVAVPEEQALGFKKTYGDSLKELNAQTGAKSEMGSTVENGHGAKVRSLLVSGSFSEAGKVMRVLQDLERGKEEPKPVEKKREPRTRAPKSDSVPYSDHPRDVVGIHAETPSTELKPWHYVLSKSGDKTRTCQIAVPEDVFVGLQTLYGPLLEGLMSGKYDGAQVAASDEIMRHGKDAGYVETRLLTFTGSENIVNSIRVNLLRKRKTEQVVVPSPVSVKEKTHNVRTVADYPPSAMKPWEIVFRAFTETHQTCDMILPQSVIDGMRVLYGEDLGGLMSGKFEGLQVSVSSVSLAASERTTEKKTAQLLTVSGPHTPIQKALHTILGMKDEERLHNRLTKHTSTCTVADLPRAQMEYWQFVLREQHGDNLVYEVLIPSVRIPALLNLVSEQMRGLTSDIVEVLALDDPTQRDESIGRWPRVLRLSGPENQVRLARATLEEFKVNGARSQKLGEGAVTSMAGTLGAWETAVCSKTNETITYELVMPEDRARVLKSIFGADFERLTTGRRLGVQVLLMSLRKDEAGAELRSVMISGPQVLAEEVRRMLLSLKNDTQFNDHLAAAKTKANTAHTSREPEAPGGLQKSAGTQSSPSLSSARTRESAVYAPISDVPSSSMADWEFAVRQRGGVNASYEIIMPADRVQGLQRRHGAELIGLTKGRWPDVHFIVSADPIRGVSSSITMSGPEVALRKLRRILLEMKSDKHFNKHMEALESANEASLEPSLQPWAMTRRTRTDDRAQFEFTLPMERLAGVQEIHGPQLDNLIGAKCPDVEVSMNTFDGHGDVFAVTAVGPHTQVQRVHSTLFGYKSDQAFRQAREALHKNEDESYDHAEIQSYVSLPSENVKAGHTVLRARSSDRLTGAVEMVITGRRWDAIDANGGVATLLREFAEVTKIEVGKKRFKVQRVISLLVEGRLRKMAQLRNILMSRNFAATSVSESGDSVARENDTITEETQLPRGLGTSNAAVDNEDYFAAASTGLEEPSEGVPPPALDATRDSTLEEVAGAWSDYVQLIEHSPSRMHLRVPLHAHPYVMGQAGRNKQRILRLAGAKDINISSGSRTHGPTNVVVVGPPSALREAIVLVGETVRHATVNRSHREREKQWLGGDEAGDSPRSYHALLEMPGATLERRREFMSMLLGPHGDQLHRYASQTCTILSPRSQDREMQRIRLISHEPRYIDAAVTRLRGMANEKTDLRDEERDGLKIVDRWTEIVQGRQYVRIEDNEGDTHVSAEVDGPPEPQAADAMLDDEDVNSREWARTVKDTSMSEQGLAVDDATDSPVANAPQDAEKVNREPNEEDLGKTDAPRVHVDLLRPGLARVFYPQQLGAHLVGKGAGVKARIRRISGADEIRIATQPGKRRGLAYVFGSSEAVKKALVLVREVLLNAQRLSVRDRLDDNARRRRMLIEIAMPGVTRSRANLLRAYVLGTDGDYAWRVANRTGAVINEKYGVADGVLSLSALERHELDAAQREVEAKLALSPDLTINEKSKGVNVVRAWTEFDGAEETSVPVPGDLSQIIKRTKSVGLPQDVLGKFKHGTVAGMTKGARELPTKSEAALSEVSQWTTVLLLPTCSDHARTQIDIFLSQDSAQNLRRIEAQTACRISKLAVQRAGEYLITGLHSGIESAQALLRLRVEVKAQLMNINLDAEHESIAVMRSGKGGEREACAADLAEDLRAVSRASTHPVMIITSRTRAESRQKETVEDMVGRCRAVTVSSFTTVTMNPVPIATFNLKVPSRTWDAISQSERLCIHFMAATPSAVAITSLFTRPYERPEEPFLALADVGARVLLRRSTASPKIKDDEGAILARVDAALLRDKCVHVGDHVVVFAEVQNITLPSEEQDTNRFAAFKRLEEKAGLAYGRREYRAMGDAISLPEVPQQVNEAVDSPDNADTGGDALESHFGVHSELPLDKARRSIVIEEEDDYDFGFGGEESTPFRDTSNATLSRTFVPPPAAGRSNFAPMGGPRQHLRHYSSQRPTRTPGNVSDTVARDPSHHSTDQKVLKSTIGDFLAPANPTVSHPSLLSNTIGEFLGETGELKSRGRIQALLNAKRTAERAARELEAALADGSLTEERSLLLEHTISVNERRVARKLAYRAADDLRRMLDTGKVDFRRSQWLESAVEKGMVICVDDARKARTLYDEGKIDELKFKEVSERLSQEHGSLNQEAMRLRQMWDEEDEGQQSDDSAEDNKRGSG